MEPPEFTSKALAVVAAAALIAMACVLWIEAMPPQDVTEISKAPAITDQQPMFKLLR